MHRGMNPDYRRAPVPPPRYRAAAGPGVGPPFTGPFNTAEFPPHFPNLPSFPIAVPPPGFERFSTEPSYRTAAPSAQFPAEWTPQKEELEVTRKAEEFLRMLETEDWIKPSSESGDGQPERHASEKHPRGRSRSKSRSRGRSRGRSRAKSRAKSRAHSRGKSRARSRSRSRGKSRGRSRSRGRSHSRAKSRPRSRSRGRSLARSKSQSRLRKDSERSVPDTEVPAVRVPELIQNLKQIIQSKELEKHLSVMKNTLMINQQEAPAPQKVPVIPMKPHDPENPENVVLPHERVSGGDGTSRLLSWTGPGRGPEAFHNKCVFSSVEDEERFLYGEDDERKKPQAVTVPLAQTRPTEDPVSSSTSRRPLTPDVSAEECERVKNLLRTIGLNLNPAEISRIATRLKQKQEEQREASSSTALRTTQEIPQNRREVQKSDDCHSNRSESSQSQCEFDHKEKEKECREKQIQKKRKEYLVKELEGLLKHEGSGDLIPVIGFFCQRCEEFFGDLKSAEEHTHTNTHQDQQLKEPTVLKDRKRQRDQTGEKEVDEDDRHSSKSGKKKKKKEKKEKKKEKKTKKRDKIKTN